MWLIYGYFEPLGVLDFVNLDFGNLDFGYEIQPYKTALCLHAISTRNPARNANKVLELHEQSQNATQAVKSQ